MLDRVEMDVLIGPQDHLKKMTPQETSVGRPNNSPP